MTQEQYQWLKNNGYDPAVHDVDDQGNIFENPINQPQQKEVMSPLRAAGTSFLGNLLPGAASLGGAKVGMMAGAPFGPWGIGLGALGGGLAAGYGVGKGQQALLENYAPEAVAEMQRAETDQPVASWAGGSAPALLTFKPSFKGISGLSAPIMSLEKDAMSKFAPAAINVAVNAGQSGAGQLLNMAQGGDFSLPRFAADTAFGAIVSNPNALGRKMGFPSLDAPNIPKIPVEQPMDLGALRTADTEAREAARVAGETEDARIMDETRGQMAAGGMTGREIEMFKTRPEMEWWKQPEATRIEDIRNIAKQAKQRMPKGMAEQLAGLPEVYDVIQNPDKFPAFLGASLEEALNAAHERSIQDRFLSPEDLAMQEKSLARRRGRDLPTETPFSDVNEAYKNYRRNAKEREEVSQRFMGAEERADIARMDETKRKLATQKASPEYRGEQMGAFREGAEAFTPEGGSRVAPESWTPEVARPTRAAITTEEILGRQSQAAKPVDEGISLEQALKPTAAEVAKAEKIQADNVRVEAEQNASEIRKMQDLEAAQALSNEAAARLQSLQARQDELQKLAQRAPSVVRKGVAEQGAPDIAQAKQELADARAIAADLYSRLQKAGGEGLMSQADLDAATRLAAQRGLRVLPATPEQQAQGIRGAYVVNENGERVIYINPLAATADTAIHEIGHDVFKTSANERMQRSLMDTAMGSEAYKRELEYRLNEVDKNGKRVNTEQRAQDLALEEGVVQAFGEQHPNVKPGEIRQWFNALKSSVKSMVGMKISPEDALAWMHYATTEAVPWKGMAVAKTGDVGGEERLQRALENDSAYLKAVESGDMETAQRMVNEAAKAAGYNEGPLYHVGQSSWTEADRPVYTQDSKELADKFLKSLRRDYPEAQAKKLYAQMENPAVQGRDIERSSFLTSSELGKEQLAEAMGKGFDSVKGYYAGLGVPEYLTTKPNQIKLADPVTYDNAGNVIPLSERFNKQSSDIRYQRAQQETPEFKNWFGESKVVDADGKPLTVYHGTDADFTSFKQAKEGYFGKGIYLTPNPDTASGYAASSAGGDTRGEGGNVMPLYASIKNPMSVVDDGFTILGPIEVLKKLGYSEDKALAMFEKAMESKGNLTGELQTKLKLQGYDGIITNHPDGTIREIIAFYPTQIKSATGNRGTFDPSNPDIRYQRPLVGKAADAVKAGVDKTLGEIDQITRRGGIFETVGRAMTRAYNTADSMLGKARSLGGTITKLNYGDATKLTSHLYNEYRNQQLLTPAPEIAAAYKEWRTQAKAFWVDETNKAGFKIMTGKGPRDRIESEYWMPAHKLSDEAREILANKIGTPEYQKLKDDYLRDATDDYLSQGKVMAKAQEKALVDFEEQRALANKTFDPSAPATFAGSRKPMGRPLPESWIEKDFRKLYESYNARSAKDYAAQQHFEKSPEVMAALGSKKFFNGQDIPANILQNTDVIAPDPSVQSVMREFSGQPLQMPGKTIRSLGSAASALALQTISRIGDVGGTVTKPLAYIGLGDYGAYMGGMAEKLSNWSKLKARSIESGLNNPNANQDFHQVIGMGEDASKYMQKVLDGIGFITGSSKLESVARTLAQAQGEMIVSINKRKAATGDKDAVRFLDTLNNDWRTQSDMDLAAQFGKMMQGTYDMRQLPAWFLEGGAAPYLTWSKWSMGQMNNFRKFAVEPAMQGNLKPLIAQVLVGMAGGGAIEQIQEWLSGKESKSVKWSELESWARQNEGKIGTDGGELLLQKFMIMAQKTGTFGFAGDLAMMPINALVGDTQSSVGVFPAAELFVDGMKNVAGALTAIDKGEDVGLVLQRFGKNVIVGKTQMARVASTWIDEVFNEGSENLRSSDRRKARLFEELSGTGRSNGMFPVSYENLAEQEFERGSITEKTGEEAFSLVSRARQEATSGEDYASRIRKLKTSQNQIMPSLERQPQKAARYLSFVEGAEPGKGGETLKRYYTRQNEDKYRKSLIEGMSGIR